MQPSGVFLYSDGWGESTDLDTCQGSTVLTSNGAWWFRHKRVDQDDVKEELRKIGFTDLSPKNDGSGRIYTKERGSRDFTRLEETLCFGFEKTAVWGFENCLKHFNSEVHVRFVLPRAKAKEKIDFFLDHVIELENSGRGGIYRLKEWTLSSQQPLVLTESTVNNNNNNDNNNNNNNSNNNNKRRRVTGKRKADDASQLGVVSNSPRPTQT
ncbi:unnamed protein product [Polarella glacialis]|uniref:Uncharacterized protein n=1 Tax=Polarella glacialis TaxID=89957 RepID=A0A813HGB1_POLGL|nr:unnamed protein product [Polarella glacialis]